MRAAWVRAARALVGVVGVAAMVGCGTGEAGAPPGEQRELIAKADPVCKEANDRVAVLGQANTPDAVRQQIEIRQDQVNRLSPLSDLGEGSIGSRFDEMVGGLQNLASVLKGVQSQLELNNQAEADRYRREAETHAATARQAASSLKMRECANTSVV